MSLDPVRPTERVTRAVVRYLTHPPHDERGDVPGWVMITVMSAALVAALTAVALPELRSMLEEALSSVR